jgi:ATP-dependent RNA helicase DDX18/HAS1
LKRIFDVNALDLAKVGKAFGFAVPPRINVNIGGGKGGNAGNKRRRIDNEEDEELEGLPPGGDIDAGEEEDGGKDEARPESRQRTSKSRRIEVLGRKKVKKEFYKKGKDRRSWASSGQWSR